MVLDLIRALPDGAAAASGSAVHLSTSVELAQAHGVAPFLGHALREAGVTPPPEAGKSLARATAESTLLAARAHSTLRAALACLSNASIPVAVLKGWPLAARLYPRAEMRLTSDVDLLVHRLD